MKSKIETWIILFLLLPGVTFACSVPVFRYALERWAPDNYEVVIFHQSPLIPEHKKVVDFLKDSTLKYNFVVRTVEQKMQAKEESPEIVLRYPVAWEKTADIWSGPLDMDSARKLFDSPLRREMGRRILKGDSAVWLLLKSGDKKKDTAAVDLLQKTLGKMQKTLKLPDESFFAVDPQIGPELCISFSLLQVSRTDPDEKILVGMLTDIEPSLKVLQDEPIAFAIFGRGRAMFGFMGEEINEYNIEAGCRFLVGMCSCEVKAQNPGVDLLMPVNWDGLVTGRMAIEEELPPLKGLSEFAKVKKADTQPPFISKPVIAEIKKKEMETSTIPVRRGSKMLLRNVLIVIGAGVIFVMLATFKRNDDV